MYLLTWHGTLVCPPDAAGILRHAGLDMPPCDLPEASLVPGARHEHPDLGTLGAMKAARPGLLQFRRGGFFMCAEMPSRRMVFDRTEASGWEYFLPLSPEFLADLRDVLGHRWIVAATRRVIGRRQIRMEDGFGLRIGPFALDLTRVPWPLSITRDAQGRPVRLSFSHGQSAVELVEAAPLGSVLVRTAPPATPRRAVADMLAVALHRHLTGLEPVPAVFEQQAALLERLGGVTGIEDFLEISAPATVADMAADADRHASLRQAVAQFSQAAPPIEADPRSDAHRAALLRAANASLRHFTSALGLKRPFSFSLYDRATVSPNIHAGAVLVDVQAGGAIFRLPDDVTLDWMRPERCLAMIFMLDAALARGAPTDARFLAEPGDDGYLPSMAYCSKVEGSCMVPDPDFFATFGYAETRAQVEALAVPWEARAAKIFWRGSTTGHRRKAPPAVAEGDDFTWLPRLDLCRRARDSALADKFDVGIAHVTQMAEPGMEARIRAAGLCRPPAPRQDFLGNKAIIVIDGNSNAWSAMFCALLSGACVLLVTSPEGYRQWYHDRLAPWQHYVPISEDLRDLDRVARWVLDNDEDARAIGAAGRAVADAITFDAAMADAADRLCVWMKTAGIDVG
jgi:hypothetical protein